MTINIYSLKEILFKGSGESVNVKSAEGELTILKNHIPLICGLEKGNLKIIDNNGKTHIIPISSGFLEVNPKEINILCQQ
ncbi:MAG: hypothetical protein COU46_03395 [Candidatus Niyogibacteria bacterium CG10_big_fil_rev_8_21_14_0_10_42_19]|uniref:ATP synthase F1 complex delta/epsilon subunit N-terminal domain-containing protein n=1 Tax=Candidatus Niyogibacteria bacterium CG10_big_fil_rev_8_21_14_0_10_42_19 TaxID=1974725 RepID=A0A2H0TEU7_9BACT|nr:MAG: hypothetical protein COU46_03395 [Candidatus Niyogibacteria bacterium CG10_big_fil_rev_8_21_14_0_10_42_19]